jgi:hypothetical protein
VPSLGCPRRLLGYNINGLIIDIPTRFAYSSNLNRAIDRDQRFAGIDTVGESNVNGVHKATYFERVGAKHVRLTDSMLRHP